MSLCHTYNKNMPMWFWTRWALHTCYVNAWTYPSRSMSLSWCCHVWNALWRFQKELRQTVFSLSTLARHATSTRSFETGIQLCLEALQPIANLPWKESACGKKMFSLDPTVLLLLCFGLSQHFVPGTKGARIVTESIWSTKCLPCCCHDSTLIGRFRVE